MLRVIRLFISFAFLIAAGHFDPATGKKMEFHRIPAGYRDLAEKIPKTGLWKDKFQAFQELKSLVVKNADSLPESIPDSRIAEAQTLLELKVLFNEVDEESLAPVRCASTRNLVAYWSSPQAESEAEIGEVGRFVISVVRSVCEG